MPFDPYRIQSPDAIMRAAKFPGGVVTPPAAYNTKKVKGASLFDRLGSAIMPSQEVEGLISPEDIKSARSQGMLDIGISLLNASGPKTAENKVGLMQAIGQGLQAGRGSFNEAVTGAAGLRNAGLQQKELQQKVTAGDMAIKQAEQMKGARAKITEAYPMPKDQGGLKQWIGDVLPHFIAINDQETVTSLSEIYKSLGGNSGQNAHYLEVPGPDGKPRTIAVTPEYMAQHPEGIPTYEKPTRDAGSQLLDEQRMFQRANMLGDDYRKTTDSIQKAADQYRTVIAAGDAAKAGNPQAQIALVFAFMKTLDPTSVVRESEYATAKNAAGVPERVRNEYNKVLSGGFLTPAQVDGFLNQSARSASQWKRQQDLHRKTFEGRAQRWKINPADVTMDFFDGLPMDFGPKQGMTGVSGGSSSTAPQAVAPKGAEWFGQ